MVNGLLGLIIKADGKTDENFFLTGSAELEKAWQIFGMG
jgi:hypothetical protein